MQVQLNLQKCQDDLINVKNELVSSEARVSFLLDKVHGLEEKCMEPSGSEASLNKH